MTNQEIKTVGQTIAQETQIGGNTAARVGGVVEGIGVALDNKDAANGYYQATISGGTITVNAPNYLLGSGGNLRIKMPSAGTGASTLTIGNANAVQLWYNGAAVSAQNTWEANEIISVFYDGTRFMASNSQGGGGKAEKISYDNSQSGLDAEDVQGALDAIADSRYPIDLSVITVGDGQANVRGRCWVVDSTARKHFVIKRNPDCNKLFVTANSDRNSSVTFLNSYSTPVNNNSLPVSACPYPCISVVAGQTKILDIPLDCNYIIIHKQTGVSQIYTPDSVIQFIGNTGLSDGELGQFNTDFTNIPNGTGWIGEFGQMVTNSGQEHYLFDLTNITNIKINAGARTTYYTWASSTDITGWTPLIATRFEISPNTTKELTVPTGANYLVIGRSTGGNDYTPSSTIFYTLRGYAEVISERLAMSIDTSINVSGCVELLGWLGGTGNFVRNNVGAAHIAIPIVGKAVTITPNSNNSYYSFASSIEGYTWTLLTGETRNPVSSVSTIEIPDGAKYIIFGVRSSYASGTEYTPQSVVFHEELPEWITRMNAPKSPKLWRMMTYNIGHLNGGGVTAIDRRRKSSITDSDYDSKKEVGLAICNQFKTDFIGVTEYPLDFAPFAASHSDETTSEILFKKYWSSYIDLNGQDPSHIGDVNYDDYNAMFGRIPLLDLHKVEWNSELLADRFYMVGTGLIGECEVKIVLAHFGFNREDMTDTTKQDIQVAELIAAFDQEQYVIIMGDLNLPSLSVLDPFIAAGYSLANGGEFGPFNTYRYTDAFANRALDHIIVKGFNIKNVYMIDSDLSDHNPFLADLEVI